MAWDIIFYATAEGSVPGADFLDECPTKVRGTILAVLDAVAAAPPPAFSGGGKWEAPCTATWAATTSLRTPRSAR
jgi:hypothetical protein